MSERCAVMTTLNGEMVEWRVFETQAQALQHYNQGVDKVQKMVNHTDDEGVWEIMLCDVKQYALSRQKAEQLSTEKSTDWYSKYLEIMSRRSHRSTRVRHSSNLNLWKKLRTNIVDSIFTDDEEPTVRGA
ncbi:MAG: hypothetical protein SA339_06430 [Methanomassiliicoccus sp.]|nr:hypothetical protein [Methanomassiliicoccus sp.]